MPIRETIIRVQAALASGQFVNEAVRNAGCIFAVKASDLTLFAPLLP